MTAIKYSRKEYLQLLIKSARDGTFPGYIKGMTTCKYHCKDGRRCALGVLISNDEYKEKYDRVMCTRDVIQQAKLLDKVEGVSEEDLISIQYIHDSNARYSWNPDSFIRDLMEFWKSRFRLESDNPD